ncbi:choice-of-anchor P family protein [Nocardioides sp. SYSU DS0663]|uniref:choice-of-anchor P family protein n=1 Tax=Nocardioides sp. SYSU DS0663 TaxID=3416445 RepID=UPI003F4B5035
MKRLTSRTGPYLGVGLATVLTAAVLPFATPAATAAPAAAEDLDFNFSVEARATPLQLEIYEPVIPIPAEPQFELNLGYTQALAQSRGGKGRASLLWPGDSIGEGAKTVIENLGLPPEVAGPLAAQGYPVQVNSNHPSGPATEANEQFPGTVMRTSAKEGEITAAAGFSTDCDVSDQEGGSGGGGGLPGLPEAPGLPLGPLTDLLGGLGGVLGLSGKGLGSAEAGAGARSGSGSDGDQASSLLSGFGAAITGKSAAPADGEASSEQAEEAAPCPIPAALAMLVDLGGAMSTSSSVVGKDGVTATSRAVLGEVRLLGGLIRLSGISTKAVTRSDGKKETASGKAHYGTLSIGPAEFALGPDGIEAAGQKQDIPGLPDQAAAALKQLGVSIAMPEPAFSTEEKTGTSRVEGIVIELDLGILSPVLSQLPLGQILNAIPFPEEAAAIKSALGAISQLSSRIVLHLGKATSQTQRAPAIDLPTAEPPSNNQTGDPEGGDTGGGGGTGGTGTTGGTAGTPGTPGTPASPGTSSPGGDAAPSDGGAGTEDLVPTAAGLPPLNSIPGALLFGGIALAAVAGSYLRKIGALALGSGAACPHGLDSGLPDLRKA